MVLAAAEGTPNDATARRLHTTRQPVARWRTRFFPKRLDGLLDEPRPGSPRTITDGDVERIIARTLETRPADATHWSTHSLAKAVGLSQGAISRIWRAFALQPPPRRDLQAFEGPALQGATPYLNPPDRAPVLCADKKCQIQALDRSEPLLPQRPGRPSAPTTASAARLAGP